MFDNEDHPGSPKIELGVKGGRRMSRRDDHKNDVEGALQKRCHNHQFQNENDSSVGTKVYHKQSDRMGHKFQRIQEMPQ